MSFIIYALPRSRTKWLSSFLTYGDVECGHEELRHMRSMEDVQSWLNQPGVGSCETAASPFWRLAAHLPTVTIRRDPEAVIASLNRLPMNFDQVVMRKQIHKLNHKLDQIEHRVPNVLSIRYDDLACEATCKTLFEHVLPYKHDHGWWQSMADLNLQINMAHLVRYYRAYAPQLTRLAKTARHMTIAQMQPKPVEQDDGVTIQEETFEHAFPDSQTMIKEHLIQIGESPDHAKNWHLIQQLEDQGSLQVMTARCNGKMFGYLVSVLAPSLESTDILTAVQTTFFASPNFRGLGIKLQRASIAALKAKGVNEIFFHAGVRGAGPRLSTLYRRLGAMDYGQAYKLEV